MSDTTTGSPSAARSAQTDPKTPVAPAAEPVRARGFFSRIAEALSPTDFGEDPTEQQETTTQSSPFLTGPISLRRMRVEDVAVPKADIVAVPVDIAKDDLVKVFRDSGKTRVPVFEDTLDQPIGFANLKDFALKHGFNGGGGRFDLRKIVRPLLYVPPSMPLGVLLQKMQSDRTHMALVVDEYGGTDGLVTIEDLIEEIVGEIEDEHDTAEGDQWSVEAVGVWLANAKTPLDEFEEEIGMSLTDHEDIDAEEVDTLGGVVFMLAGHVPARGEVVRHPDGAEFEVLEADPRRIKQLRVRLPSKQGG